MNAANRLFLAWSADTARAAGKPGEAARLEHQLSEAMLDDYAAFEAREAERHIAEHHRRRPRFPGRP